MILGTAILAGSSSLFRWACTYRIANFSLGGLNIGPLGETGYVCHSPQFRPTDLRRKGRIVTWWWPFSHSPSEKSRGSGKHHDGCYYRVELTDMPPPEAAQEGAQGGWRLDHAAWNTDRPTSAQRIGVVDAVAASQRGSDRRQHLVPSVRPSRRAAQVKVMVDKFPQAQVPGEGGRHWPPGDGRQRGCGYGRDCSVAASIGCSLFPGGFLFQNHYPRFRGAPSGFFKDCPQGRPSVDSG